MSLSVGIFDYDKWARMPEKTLSAPPSRKKLAVLAEKKWSHVPNSKAFEELLDLVRYLLYITGQQDRSYGGQGDLSFYVGAKVR